MREFYLATNPSDTMCFRYEDRAGAEKRITSGIKCPSHWNEAQIIHVVEKSALDEANAKIANLERYVGQMTIYMDNCEKLRDRADEQRCEANAKIKRLEAALSKIVSEGKIEAPCPDGIKGCPVPHFKFSDAAMIAHIALDEG